MTEGIQMALASMIKMAILAAPTALSAKSAGNGPVKRSAILTVLLALSACAAPLAGNSPAAAISTVNFMPDLALTALAEGRLHIRNGCIRLIGRDGGNGAHVIWPKGSRLVMRGGQKTVIEGGDGAQYVIGQRVSLGGGMGEEVANEILTEPLPTECRGPFFFAN